LPHEQVNTVVMVFPLGSVLEVGSIFSRADPLVNPLVRININKREPI
jgi:hypothetical protein